MDYQTIAILASIGIVAGILSGILGLGGAIIIIPALVMFVGFSQQMAQGTTLLMMVLPVGALAAMQYYQKGFADVNAALIMAFFFLFGAYFGAKVATQIPQDVLRKVFAVLLVAMAIKIGFQK